MSDSIKEMVKAKLDSYLAVCNHRKTPERYAILDAVYSMPGHFTLVELGELLEKRNFRVSRATLYNTVRLFLQLRLVVRHRLADGTYYEGCYNHNEHVHQVCTMCGKMWEIEAPELTAAMENLKLRRVRKDSFTLYIYGVCSHCAALFTRRKGQTEKEKTKKNNSL